MTSGIASHQRRIWGTCQQEHWGKTGGLQELDEHTASLLVWGTLRQGGDALEHVLPATCDCALQRGGFCAGGRGSKGIPRVKALRRGRKANTCPIKGSAGVTGLRASRRDRGLYQGCGGLASNGMPRVAASRHCNTGPITAFCQPPPLLSRAAGMRSGWWASIWFACCCCCQAKLLLLLAVSRQKE